MKKSAKKEKPPRYKLEWDLTLLYKSPIDPQIEKDMLKFEILHADFAKKYDLKEKRYLSDETALLEALTDYEKLSAEASAKPLYYFHYRQHMDSQDKMANEKTALFSARLAKAGNLLQFFNVSFGKISEKKQKEFLASKKLSRFKVILERAFADAKHLLSESEENIISLKRLPAYELWIQGNEKLLGSKFVIWPKGKGAKEMPLTEAFGLIPSLEKSADRQALASLVKKELKENSAFAESELNAIVTDKKMEDDLRGYKNASDATIQSYRNDPDVVLALVDVVTKSFSISQRYYRLKAKIMGKKTLAYADRNAKIGKIGQKFSVSESVGILKKAFGDIDPKFAAILASYAEKGQIDWKPRQGKHGGGYCSSSYGNPTFVLLNHMDTFDSFKTLAHEMGHAFHGELSEGLGPIYSSYSISLAETASTLFEQIGFEAVFENLSDKEKIVALEQKLNDEMRTIFNQIAGFNYEKDIHAGIRAKGFLSAADLAALHVRNMGAYLGPAVAIEPDDGYLFVGWIHLRYFFYMYTYAYGMLVSKALLRRYKRDKSFWKKIEQFLSAGGKDSPENILRGIGIDVSKPDFWRDGLKEIEDEVAKLEKLTRKK